MRSDTGVGLVEAASCGVVAPFSAWSVVVVTALVTMMGGERGDGILASTVGVGNSPLGKIVSPRGVDQSVDGSATVIGVVGSDSDWSNVVGAVVYANAWAVAGLGAVAWATGSGLVAFDRSKASCGGVWFAVDRSTAVSCTRVGLGATVNWFTAFALFERSKQALGAVVVVDRLTVSLW